MFRKFLTVWHPMRLLRMGVSIAALVQGIVQKDIVVAVMGVIFGIATIFNVGCCSYNGGCSSGKCDVEK